MGGVVAWLFQLLYRLIQIYIVAIVAVKWVSLGIPVLVTVLFFLLRKVLPSIRESVKVTSHTKSPLLTCLSETMRGSSTIRAFKKKQEFINRNNKFLNANILAVII